VKGYPTIKYWEPNSEEAQDYRGGRDFDSLKKHADSLAASCDVKSLSDCDDKEKGYIEKWNGKDKAAVEKELARLNRMQGNKMSAAQKKFLKQRISILGQL
jgi:hypothetical protein